MLANITYNRSKKRYELAHDKDVFFFAPGRGGRQAAFRAAVRLENHALWEAAWAMVEQEPALESRIWKACEIIIEGGVTPADNGDILALVASQSSEYGDYVVQMVDGLVACDCEDFQGGTAVYTEGSEQPLCKHVLAYQLSQIAAPETAV